MFRIGKTFKFEAAHHLPSLPEGHKCARVHGHSYEVEIVLQSHSMLAGPGFVMDFADFASVKEYIDKELDHQDLNTVLGFAPTSERLAMHMYYWVIDNVQLPPTVLVDFVSVSETDSTWAAYSE